MRNSGAMRPQLLCPFPAVRPGCARQPAWKPRWHSHHDHHSSESQSGSWDPSVLHVLVRFWTTAAGAELLCVERKSRRGQHGEAFQNQGILEASAARRALAPSHQALPRAGPTQGECHALAPSVLTQTARSCQTDPGKRQARKAKQSCGPRAEYFSALLRCAQQVELFRHPMPVQPGSGRHRRLLFRHARRSKTASIRSPPRMILPPPWKLPLRPHQSLSRRGHKQVAPSSAHQTQRSPYVDPCDVDRECANFAGKMFDPWSHSTRVVRKRAALEASLDAPAPCLLSPQAQTPSQ
mmetsp:Transcript_8145/g.19077  ORF Transcript_8145/g.19077 Transcript_8145/m.19077 type:complete len:295 (-) Transcript_8145:212-1096(-)